ncbi:MAG: TonB-dependent receptor [Bryobacterales bacterium]
MEPRVLARDDQRAASVEPPLAEVFGHVGRQHRLGRRARFAESVRRDGLADHLRPRQLPLLQGWGCWDGDNRKDEALTSYQINDDVTWVKGKHSMNFGVKLRQEYNNVRELQQAQGSHEFGPGWTSQFDPNDQQAVSYTGSGLGSTLLGLPTYLSNQANRGYFYFQQFELGAYFQDSWKVNQRLTLELGVRYDRWAPYGEKYNRLVNVDLTSYENQFQVITPGDSTMESLPGILPSMLDSWALRGLTWTTANSAGFPSKLIPADNNNFGPRLGAAYRINDKLVVRASYGEYFWTMPLSQILQTSRTNPPLNLRYQNDVSTQQGTQPYYAISTAPANNDYVQNNSVPTDGIVPLSINAQPMMAWDVRDWSDNRMQSWHFTVERALGGNTALRLSYLGNHGRDLEQRFQVNPRESEWNYQARTGEIRPGRLDLMRPNPDWNFSALNHTGYSNSNSLQAEIERRYSNGIAFQWFYTFSRTMTTSDAGGFTSGNGSINATGTANFDVPAVSQLLGEPNLSYDERLRLGYVNSGSVPAHRTSWNALIDLPFGKGKKFGRNASGVLNGIIGGWQLATIGTWTSGFWRGVGSGYLFGDPTLSGAQQIEMTFGGQRRRLFFRGDFDPTLATDVDSAALQGLVPTDRSQRVAASAGLGLQQPAAAAARRWLDPRDDGNGQRELESAELLPRTVVLQHRHLAVQELLHG